MTNCLYECYRSGLDITITVDGQPLPMRNDLRNRSPDGNGALQIEKVGWLPEGSCSSRETLCQESRYGEKTGPGLGN
jgi:hypothetical protein